MGLLVGALLRLGEHAEAEALGRETLEKRCRVLGRDHFDALTASANLAVSLSAQGKLAKAVEIERGVIAQAIRLLSVQSTISR